MSNWKDQIQIELIPELCAGSDLSIANVARVSFNKWKEEKDDGDDALVRYLANHQHSSPFRHTSIGVRCTAPIHVARQLVKHQAGLSWNEVSRRYVKEPVELFNQEFRAAPEGSIKQGSAGIIMPEDVPEVRLITGTDTTEDIDIFSIQESLLGWYDKCIAEGIAPETVRGYMPLNMQTSWVWTGNLMAFHHMYKLRIDAHAQKEVQVFAEKAAEVMKPLFPVAWDALSGVDAWRREQMLKDVLEGKDG